MGIPQEETAIVSVSTEDGEVLIIVGDVTLRLSLVSACQMVSSISDAIKDVVKEADTIRQEKVTYN